MSAESKNPLLLAKLVALAVAMFMFANISLYPVACLAFSILVSTVYVFDHISASSKGRYRGGLVIGEASLQP